MRYLIILMFFSVVHDVGASARDDPLPGAERFAALMRGCHSFDLEAGMPCAPSTDISAWLNGLSEEGFLALKSFTDMKSTLEGKEAIMSRAWEAGLVSEEVLLAREYCAGMGCVGAFFSLVKQKNADLLAPAARIFRAFEACYLKEGGFIPQTQTGNMEEEGRALLACLRHQDPATVSALAEADLPTYQLQMFMAYKHAIATENMPFLLSLLKDVRQNVEDIFGPDACVHGQERTSQFLASFFNTPPHLITIARNAPLACDVRLTFVEGVKRLRVRQAEVAVKLLEAEPGRDVRNLISKMEKSYLIDAELEALEALPPDTRRCQFVVSGVRLKGEDLGFIKGLFAGMNADQEQQFERALRHWHPATNALRYLHGFGFTPLQSALMMDTMAQNPLIVRILSAIDEEKLAGVMTLYRRLIAQCTHTDALRITLDFDIDTQEERATFLPFAQTLAALEFPPEVRAELLSRKVPVESLPILKAMFDGMTFDHIKRTLVAISLYHWESHMLALVENAHFPACHLAHILEHRDWLEIYGWLTPAHLTTLKCALEGAYAPHAQLILERLFASQMAPDAFAGLSLQGFSPEEFLENLKSFQTKRFRSTRSLF